MFAAGAIPKPPTTCADSSERMSPNIFVVTITSNDSGCLMRFIAHASTYISSKVMSGYSFTTAAQDLANKLSDIRITLDL